MAAESAGSPRQGKVFLLVRPQSRSVFGAAPLLRFLGTVVLILGSLLLFDCLASEHDAEPLERNRDTWLSRMKGDPDFKRDTLLFGIVLLAATMMLAVYTATYGPWHEALAVTALGSVIASPVLVIWATCVGAHGMATAERLATTESGPRLAGFAAIQFLVYWLLGGFFLFVLITSEALAASLLGILDGSLGRTLTCMLFVLAAFPLPLWFISHRRRFEYLRRSFFLVGDSVSSPLATLIAWLATRIAAAGMRRCSWVTLLTSASRLRVLGLGLALIVTGVVVYRAGTSDLAER